jgi:hypothetical protein
MIDGMRQIAQEDGISSLWNGALASTVLVSNPTIQFAAYEQLKSYMNKKDLSSYEVFILSSISKLIATLITYPIQVAQSNMRSKHKTSGSKSEKPKYANTIDCLVKLFQENGIYGWFKGKIFETNSRIGC